MTGNAYSWMEGVWVSCERLALTSWGNLSKIHPDVRANMTLVGNYFRFPLPFFLLGNPSWFPNEHDRGMCCQITIGLNKVKYEDSQYGFFSCKLYLWNINYKLDFTCIKIPFQCTTTYNKKDILAILIFDRRGQYNFGNICTEHARLEIRVDFRAKIK